MTPCMLYFTLLKGPEKRQANNFIIYNPAWFRCYLCCVGMLKCQYLNVLKDLWDAKLLREFNVNSRFTFKCLVNYILPKCLQFTNICKNVALVSTSLQVPYFTHSDLITFPVDELYEIKSPVMLIHRELTATSCSK